MYDIDYSFDNLFQVISSQGFLKMESLGGEIPFYISAYDAKQELEVQKAIRGLRKKLESNGIPVLEINLYDLTCEILENDDGGMELMKRVEKKSKNKKKFLRALQSSLNIHEVLMEKIAENIKAAGAKVYFITGIGLVFPFIRSHNILNNLQNIAKDAPTVTFFPGEYNGESLNLFGLFKDDNYYRAFNIENIKT
jgi:hypothetical protein